MKPSPDHLVSLWAWTALLVVSFGAFGAAIWWAASTESIAANATLVVLTATTCFLYQYVRHKQYRAERRDRFLTGWFLESCDKHTVSKYWREMAEEIRAAEKEQPREKGMKG